MYIIHLIRSHPDRPMQPTTVIKAKRNNIRDRGGGKLSKQTWLAHFGWNCRERDNVQINKI